MADETPWEITISAQNAAGESGSKSFEYRPADKTTPAGTGREVSQELFDSLIQTAKARCTPVSDQS
jgi:hypothetical protein